MRLCVPLHHVDISVLPILEDTGFFRLQGIVKVTVSGESGQLQFWSEPSEILNLRSSNTPETVAFTIP
jgi:hypothetical protein